MRFWVCAVLVGVVAAPTRGAAQPGASPSARPDSLTRPNRLRWEAGYVAGYRDAGNGWGPAREQVTFGIVDAIARRPRWPVALAVRMALSYTPAVPPGSREDAGDAGSYDITFGVRRDLFGGGPAAARVWAGGGAAILGASIRSKTLTGLSREWEDHDATVGPYLEAGVQRHWRGPMFVGLAGSWSHGHVRPEQTLLHLGGFQALLLIGVRLGDRSPANRP